MDNTQADFIGKGITFPLELTNGKPSIMSGIEIIRSSIYSILNWQYKTRFFLCEYGSRLYDLLEEPNDEVLSKLVRTFVVDAITNWEKRIALKDAYVERVDATAVYINLTYVILNTQIEDNFVYPFYRELIY